MSPHRRTVPSQRKPPYRRPRAGDGKSRDSSSVVLTNNMPNWWAFPAHYNSAQLGEIATIDRCGRIHLTLHRVRAESSTASRETPNIDAVRPARAVREQRRHQAALATKPG